MSFVVYNMMGFWDEEREHWDYLRCAINFDGAVNANANSRFWVISDHYSDQRVYDAGVMNISMDRGQDWKSSGKGQNYTECPLLQKCIFQCSASRNYETKNSKEDYQFTEGDTKVNFYYGVYFLDTMLAQGGVDYEKFKMPLIDGSLALSAVASSLVALLCLQL